MAAERPVSSRPRRLSPPAKKKLRQPPAPEHVSSRVTDDGELRRFIEGWRAIQIANDILGEDRWGAEVVGEVTYHPIPQTGRRNATPVLGFYTALVRVTVDGCPPHSDVGTGEVQEQTPEAHVTACKAAVTDGLKRALRRYGPALGNELYEPDPAAAMEALREQAIALGERGGSDAERTREWVEARYGCPLDLLDRPRLEQVVSHLARGIDRRAEADDVPKAA